MSPRSCSSLKKALPFSQELQSDVCGKGQSPDVFSSTLFNDDRVVSGVGRLPAQISCTTPDTVGKTELKDRRARSSSSGSRWSRACAGGGGGRSSVN